ncbi:PucR family transcriptional regulator [Diplocloster modestus]|uniref:PucR family transcriptional regulator ligand-binding domain-containing protein n=1 Tax=Diplocloster modestus TaxID=2850322 RepID=A0ABS6K3C6_9FIRM|nr:PucR family transcriptional regulator ligand-binding domain-containing protein [Diplocloster modestus]MBU9725011.1 PucR family transcriptional regulator ligand-binding domain-containing protein [Diplocloster modestus]
MSITCHDLLSLNSFKKIKLIAGELGLYRPVIWPYTGTTSSVSQWLHGGELLFITGAGIDVSEDGLLLLLHDCLQKHLAGLIIITGNKYIPEIPPKMIRLADEMAFPLFSMPWNLRLIDVTREIINAITVSDDFSKKISTFTEMLVFSSEKEEAPLRDLAGLYGVRIKTYHFLFSISIREHSEKTKNSIILSALKETFQAIENLYENQYSITPMYYANQILCFCSVKDYSEKDEVFQVVTSTFQLICTRYKDEHLSLAISSCYPELTSIRKCWKEILFLNQYLEFFSPQKRIVTFDELGMYRLLFQYSSSEDRKRFYMPYLHILLEHDENNSSEFIGTLKKFIENNGNLLKTSEALFIHRNTLIYRINSIKKLLNSSLEDIDTRITLYLSILFYEYDQKESLY